MYFAPRVGFKLDCGYVLSFGQQDGQVGQWVEEEGVLRGKREEDMVWRWRWRRECISYLF